ncbi:type II secretion system protein N [Gilvimarinus sp. F26214L]|uniref:type II secretion system protein N n=1 Tax=Gilvimarinus sp. DZF01 TaxID=3461371 RepID=UPI00404660C7
MKKKLKGLAWILLPLLVWLALVVRNTPAQWGIWLAGLPLQMDGVTGTVWNGQVANVVLPYGGEAYSLGRLDWTLNPWSLLTLSPCARFNTELNGQTASGTACAGLGNRLILKDTEVSVPAAIAEIWAPVRVRGRVDAQIVHMTLAEDQVRSLRGSGSWSGASYHNSQSWVNLGTIAFDLTEDGEGGVGAQVFDIEGPLELDLNSRFTLAGAYAIRGNIGLRQDAPPELGQLLRIVANQTRPGQFSVEWVGS